MNPLAWAWWYDLGAKHRERGRVALLRARPKHRPSDYGQVRRAYLAGYMP